MSKTPMVSSVFMKSSLALLWLLAVVPVRSLGQQSAVSAREVIVGAVGAFFGRENLAVMQRSSFGFEVHYSAGIKPEQLKVTVLRQGKKQQLSDTVVRVLSRFLNQVVPHAAQKRYRAKVRIDEHTSFDKVTFTGPPVISVATANIDAWNDTFRRYVVRYLELYPGDCNWLHCIRGVYYSVAPLQDAVISRIVYAACDTGQDLTVFLTRFRGFMAGKLPLSYVATAEGCAEHNFYNQPIVPTPDEERVWCIINRFGYTQYTLFRIPAADCD